MTEREVMIRAEGLRKRYGALEVLRGVSLEVARGEVVSIVGASGAGKTTLLQIIGSLTRPDGGRVTLGGIDPFALSDRELSRFRNRRVGFVFQFHHLLPEFTAFENVCLPGLIGGRDRREVGARAAEPARFDGALGTPRPQTRRVVGRRAAARGHCPCADQLAFGAAGRRTFGQSRYAQPRGDTPALLRACASGWDRPSSSSRTTRVWRRVPTGRSR